MGRLAQVLLQCAGIFAEVDDEEVVMLDTDATSSATPQVRAYVTVAISGNPTGWLLSQ